MNKNESKKIRAVSLIKEMRSGVASDERQVAIVDELDRILPDPNYWDYMIDNDPKMTAEQVVEKAFSYNPIIV
ncbi:hypothetical protein GOB46_20335 [Sinorhizobium meliloti]|uniref:hypothetical protein n=1 Tax=Rhizobium meliloti TaxID=382 RepID=UPI00299E4EFD|nr:hypothetical protein [Sinorhizobium meliloti]MDW9873682.1 hypothetical protein [Sinorhizobium meliloti]MDW9886084.1 hypothetical protein [Sinorhizobium meliloti]MDX0208089.1 hypothetical protein [Sinorhizobium meliloti]